MHKLRTLHLFAGAGGGILADLLLGHQPVCAVEIDAYCQQVLSARQKDGILPWFPVFGDIKKFDGKPWRGVVEIIAGGFPCQDISVAGRGAGIDGSRSGIWKEMLRVVREVQPRKVLVENSPTLLTRGMGTVIGDLAKVGYDARWGVFSACSVGAPHTRERLFIMANSKRFGQSRGWKLKNGGDEIKKTNSSERCEDSKKNKRPVQVPIWNVTAGEVVRIPDGVANWIHRVRAVSNSQVPAVAALAWNILK